MKQRSSTLLWLIVLGMIFCQMTFSVAAEEKVLVTHEDAVIFFAKYSGLFDQHVKKNSSTQECVDFFNKHGVYFKKRDIISGAEFTKKDCARVMGQLELVFKGKAELSGGKVKLPKGVEHWEDFCILNDVKFIEGYKSLKEILLDVGI